MMNRCPHCRGVLPASRSTIWQQQQRAKGLCVRCLKLKVTLDDRFWHCTPCRRIRAAAARARYRRMMAA